MKTVYDAEMDTLHIVLKNSLPARTEEVRSGVFVNLDSAGRLIGIELIDASLHVDSPETVEHQIRHCIE